jgi:hypothetical protein
MDDEAELTIGGAIQDLGWFSWIFALVVGGPSCLALLQAVFVDHELLAALGWIVDGYNRILDVVGGIFEPLLTSVLRAIGDLLHLSLSLQPHWKQLFVLGMIFVVSYARTAWRGRQRVSAVMVGLALTALALICAASASLAPLDNWLTHGWAALSMTTLLAIVLAVTVTLQTKRYKMPARVANDGSIIQGRPRYEKRTERVIGVKPHVFLVCVLAFALGAVAAFVPQLSASAGVVVFILVLLGTGARAVVAGVRETNISSARLGLTILGGFLAAAIILIADRALSLGQ